MVKKKFSGRTGDLRLPGGLLTHSSELTDWWFTKRLAEGWFMETH